MKIESLKTLQDLALSWYSERGEKIIYNRTIEMTELEYEKSCLFFDNIREIEEKKIELDNMVTFDAVGEVVEKDLKVYTPNIRENKTFEYGGFNITIKVKN